MTWLRAAPRRSGVSIRFQVGGKLLPQALDGRIEFVGLPAAELTLEIYNLAGDLIRTLRKDDLTASTLVWDVRTESGLPPASGMYIYRVIAPGIGEKVGKLAVFTEVEQLRRF